MTSESRRYGPWVSDPTGYYLEHYAGLTRSKLQHEHPGLYHCLYRRDALDIVPTNKPFGGDPYAYYLKHFGGKSRGYLGKHQRALYMALRRSGGINEVPVLSKARKDEVGRE